MVRVPKMLDKGSVGDVVRKLISKSAPSINPKRPIIQAVNKILRYARSTSAGKIGIHGIGGIGKTSVLKALINCPEIKSTFDIIIFVTISRHWSRRHLQTEIARQLSLRLGRFETDEQIADKLYETLSSRKFLLIVDDVWNCIDLDASGIPHMNKKNGSKIVLAAREVEIFRAMAVDKEIEMGFLSLEEAEKLFQDQVGGSIESSSLLAMVEECGGLPLLLTVIGRAMRMNNNWNKALQDLQFLSRLELDDVETHIVHLLKFSYYRLMAADVRKCFLYAAAYQESQEITVLELVKHCIREGIISGNLADSLERGYEIVEILTNACLLEKTNDGLAVKMQKVIRDLAVWIISTKPEDYQNIVSQPRNNKVSNYRNLILSRASAGLTEPPPMEDRKTVETIFLMDNKFSWLHERPSCPKLVTFFLQNNINLRSIPDSFFENMPLLQVLDLSQSGIKSLPPSLFKIHKLKKLILRDCPFLVELTQEIGSLEYLEVLDLQGTEISKLPDEVGKLSILRNLQVSFYGPIGNCHDLPCELIPAEIISRLLKLEELGIVVRTGDSRWNKSINSITEEVAELKNLTDLQFYFPDDDILDFFIRRSSSWALNTLSKFKFVVGHNINRIVSQLPKDIENDYDHEERCLRFMCGDRTPDAVLRVLNRATSFYLDHHLTSSSLTLQTSG